MPESTDTPLSGGLPAWVRAIAYVGFPTAVALFFMGQSAGYIPSRPSVVQEEVNNRVKAIAADLSVHRQRQEELLYTLSIGVRVLCENSAHTPVERNNCSTIPTNKQQGLP